METERARLDKLVSSGADESDQTHQHAVIEEAASMIPDTLGRIEAAASDLEAFMVSMGPLLLFAACLEPSARNRLIA